MKKYLLILSALLLTWIGASAQTITSGSYMIVNTETEQFLYGSYNWGCRASLGSKLVFWTVTPTGENTYTLSTQQWTDTKYMYLTTDNQYYCDGGTSTNYTLTIEGDDNDGYTISYNGYYVYAELGKNNYVTSTTDSSSASHFKFVSLDDVKNDMANASSSNPVDVTALIDDANFKPGGNELTAKNNWAESGITGHGRYQSNTVDACCAESWNQSAFSISQTITLPCKGVYSLSAQGFYRNGSDGNGSYDVSGTMYVGDHTMDLPKKHGSESDMPSAWAAFLEGTEPIDAITFEAEKDAEVEIGFTGAAPTYSWVIFGELTLMYYGEELTYAIGEPECSVKTVAPGGTVTITFPNCITPTDGEEPVLSTTAGSITVNGENVTDANLTYSGTTATVTFTVPQTIERGSTVIVSVPAGLVTWADADVSSPAEAVTFTFTTPLIEDQLGVYLFNLGENEFLSRGHNNDNTTGTAADVDVYGLPVDITANADGKYNIRYIDSNLYLGGMYWATANEALANAASFTIVAEEADGKTDDGKTIYRFRNGSSSSTVTGDLYVNNGTSHGPLGLNDDDNGINSVADRQWVIYSKAERDALKEANVLAAKLNAAQALDFSFSGTTDGDFNTFIGNLNSEDATSKVGGASLASTEDLASWTEDDYALDGSGFTAGNNTIETYNDVDDLTQTITGLEEGIYKVTLQGFNRMGDAAYILANLADYDISLATLGANDDEINLKTWASDRPTEDVYNNKYASLIAANDSYFNAGYDYFPNSQYQASLIFGDEAYQNELYTYVSEGGSLTITIACPDYLGANWVVFTNLTLTRYYTDDIYTNDVTWKLANPSFEVDNVVADLSEDETRENTEKVGAWGVTSLTGWDLTAPTGDGTYNVCDIMTADAQKLDNEFAVPEAAAEGSQWLYLRDAWHDSGVASVMQKVTLPAGNYKVSVDNMCISTGSGHSATLTVEDIASTSLPIYTATPDAWNTSSVKFFLTEDTEVTLGVDISFANASGLSVLLDNFKLYSAAEIEEEISWTMTSAGWGTMILPFSATLEDGLTAYSCSGTEESEDEDGSAITVVSLTEVTTGIAANTPYIIECTDESAIKEYTFSGVPTNEKEIYSAGLLTGTLVDLAVAKGAAFATDGTQYLLQHHDGVDDSAAFYPIIVTDGTNDSSEATLDAYHCYLTLDSSTSGGSGVRASISLPGSGEETAIKAIEGAEAEVNGAIYDLSGRKVSKAVKGVYIQNGKKVLVK